MQSITQNIRYALRQLRRSPAFTLTAVLTLAIGIGANVAVFSVMNAVLLNPSGIPNPERVVALRARYQIGNLSNISMSAPDFSDAVDTQLLSTAAVMRRGNINYAPQNGDPEVLMNAQVSSPFFDVFSARPLMGRVFRPEEDVPGADKEVVLSYSTWRKKFGADPFIVGKKLTLNRQFYEVVGVMGPAFGWPNEAQVWTPLGFPPQRFHDNKYRYNENLFALGRLKPGVTLPQLNGALAQKAQQQGISEGKDSFAKASGWGMFSMPLVEFVAGDLRKPLSVLLGAVAVVLLIVCANIAGLQLARASERQRETSIRIALGAQRGRLLQHSFIESAILSLAGLVLGLLCAKFAIPLLLLLAPDNLVRNIGVTINVPVLLYVCAAGVLCAVLCGVAPAWQLTRVRWFQSLQESGRSNLGSHTGQRLRSSLVVCEIAMAMLLLVAAGLLVRSLKEVERVEAGFDPQGTMSASLVLPEETYKTPEQQEAFITAAEEQVKSAPGVATAALADALPFSGDGGSASFSIVGRPTGPNDPGPHGNVRQITPDYFSTMRIPIVRGRGFNSIDRAKTEQVAVIDETLARQYWPNEDPIGQHINVGDKSSPIAIVGLVKHAKVSALDSDQEEGFYYLPLAQAPSKKLQVVARAKSDPATLITPMQSAIKQVDSNQAVYGFKSMEQRVDESLVSRRFLVILLSVFAGLALLLAAIGLYGVISYGVRMKVRELGIRMALGAKRSDVLKLVIGQGMGMAATGLLLGLIATLIAGRVLASLLYRTSLYHPATLLSTGLVLALTVLLASYLPARRASNLDPVRTLRQD